MATIINFLPPATPSQPDSESKARTYSLDISAFPDSYIEFTANNVKTDAKSLFKIADELEKIASIIRSDVLTAVV